jgi:hypothetical protein
VRKALRVWLAAPYTIRRGTGEATPPTDQTSCARRCPSLRKNPEKLGRVRKESNVKNLKNIGMMAAENSAFDYEETCDYYKEIVQKYPLLEHPMKSHDAEAIAEIVVIMGATTIDKILEEVNERAAILNNPIMGRLLLFMVLINIQKEIKNLEKAALTLMTMELFK